MGGRDTAGRGDLACGAEWTPCRPPTTSRRGSWSSAEWAAASGKLNSRADRGGGLVRLRLVHLESWDALQRRPMGGMVVACGRRGLARELADRDKSSARQGRA
jgi:hypothetical protein